MSYTQAYNPLTGQFNLVAMPNGANNFKTPVSVATTANLTATYNNGTAGVGATLTNSGSLTALVIDGQTPSVGNRILVKNQSTTYQNGIYSLTTAGSGSVAWVLTRTTDYDTPTEISPGSIILVVNGTSNANSYWIQTQTVVTVGTSPILFTEFLQTQNIKVVVPGSFPYTANAGDGLIVCNISGASTVNLEASPMLGSSHIIKDNSGTAATNNITITPNSGNIDGGSSYVINANYGAVEVIYNGTQWNIT
jgi:hypothetical protein